MESRHLSKFVFGQRLLVGTDLLLRVDGLVGVQLLAFRLLLLGRLLKILMLLQFLLLLLLGLREDGYQLVPVEDAPSGAGIPTRSGCGIAWQSKVFV